MAVPVITGTGSVRKSWRIPNYQCPNCKQLDTTVLTLSYGYRHAYYIPWMTHDKSYSTRCSACQAQKSLTPADATKLVPGALPNFEQRFGCLILVLPTVLGMAAYVIGIDPHISGVSSSIPVYLLFAGCGGSFIAAIALFVAHARRQARK